jgi:hypothetical protein
MGLIRADSFPGCGGALAAGGRQADAPQERCPAKADQGPDHTRKNPPLDGERNGRLPDSEWTPTQLTQAGKLHRTVIVNDAPGANFNINQQGSSVVAAGGLARNAISRAKEARAGKCV